MENKKYILPVKSGKSKSLLLVFLALVMVMGACSKTPGQLSDSDSHLSMSSAENSGLDSASSQDESKEDLSPEASDGEEASSKDSAFTSSDKDSGFSSGSGFSKVESGSQGTSKPTPTKPATTPVPTSPPTATPSSSPTPTPDLPPPDNRDYNFNGPISKEVLNNYLSRAVTHNGLAAFAGYGNIPAGGNPDFEEDFRMLKSIGAKFIGRAAHVWGTVNDEEHYAEAKRIAGIVHAYDPQIVLQSCIFEAVYKSNVDVIPVPAWVFEAFDLPVENRNFKYEDMLFLNGNHVGQWNPGGGSIPDLTRPESQMWFYYRAVRYIDAGYEAIHLGQITVMTKFDNNKTQIAGLIAKIRDYASKKARRKWVILDAHSYNNMYYYENGKKYLLLDFHSFPLRPRDNFPGNKEFSDGYQPARLEVGYLDSVYGRSTGGIHPAGWETEYNPFLCEFDNHGYDKDRRDVMRGDIKPWGYDEITWFAKQPERRRAQILLDFHDWINDRYQYGNIQMPTKVPLAFPFSVQYVTEEYGTTTFSNIHFFKANTQSPTSLATFNLEQDIKRIWSR